MDRKREFWKHLRTGEIWAVEVHDGRVVACCGPVPRSQRLESVALLQRLAFAADGVPWVERERPYWMPVFKQALAA